MTSVYLAHSSKSFYLWAPFLLVFQHESFLRKSFRTFQVGQGSRGGYFLFVSSQQHGATWEEHFSGGSREDKLACGYVCEGLVCLLLDRKTSATGNGSTILCAEGPKPRKTGDKSIKHKYRQSRSWCLFLYYLDFGCEVTSILSSSLNLSTKQTTKQVSKLVSN